MEKEFTFPNVVFLNKRQENELMSRIGTVTDYINYSNIVRFEVLSGKHEDYYLLGCDLKKIFLP
jgi:hypothetical protein